MATPDEIPTDLTLEIGENLSPDRFMAAARAFFGYVQEVAEAVEGDGEHVHWTVRVREGSHLIGVAPVQPAIQAGMLAAIYTKAETGLSILASGRSSEAGLSDTAMKHLRVLSELTDATHGKPVKVNLWVRKKPVIVSPEVGRVVREDHKAAYNDYGTLEGRLRTIQDNGSVQLMLRDEMLGLNLRCYVSDDLLPTAFVNFRKRVEVIGLIHYRANGIPISIEVSGIDPLPDDDDLPTPEEVRGLLRVAG
jgi:hypothetical protein